MANISHKKSDFTKFTNWLILQNEFEEDFVLTRDPNTAVQWMRTLYRCLSKEKFQKLPLASAAVQGQHAVTEVLKERSPLLIQGQNSIDLSSIQTLEDLHKAMLAFEGCSLKKTALNTVFGNGNPKSSIMLIGEGPGADEDKQGLPFVGRSGQLLNKMLASIGLQRRDVYITNVVNWRPPNNRTPEPIEIAQCLPFLKKHIDLIHPKIIVLLGLTAIKAVLNWKQGLSKARHIWHPYTLFDGTQAKVMATFHPAYLLRSPDQKKFAWEDLLRLKEEILHFHNP